MKFLVGVVVGAAAVALWRSGAAAWLYENADPSWESFGKAVPWFALGLLNLLFFMTRGRLR